MATGCVISHKSVEMKGLYVRSAGILFYAVMGGNPDPQLNAFTVFDHKKVLNEHRIGPEIEVPDNVVQYAKESEAARHQAVDIFADMLRANVGIGKQDLKRISGIASSMQTLFSDDDDKNSAHAEQVFALIAAAENVRH
jgi:hypothetical protein